jgi:type IV pilus assembly protein PilB
MLDDNKLTELLISAKKINQDSLKKASDFAASNKISLYNAITQLELVSDQDVGSLVAQTLNLPFISLTSQESIAPEVIKIIPETLAQKYKIIAFQRSEAELRLAVADPANKAIIPAIEKKTGLKAIIYYATENDIDHIIATYRQDLQKKFEALLKESMGMSAASSQVVDPPIEKILYLLVSSAYDQKASDIHIEPKENESLVRLRIDGILYDSLHFPLAVHERIVTRIKVLSNLRTDEHLSAQDGKMQVTLEAENLDLRVSILPIADGEKVVLRLLSSKSRSFSLTDLGMSDIDLAKLTDAYTKPNGMILSTGPTGSGKTTTIYSILKVINTRDKNITSVEDPVEYKIAGANQIQVNVKTNLTFANGLRSVLRQDPDYIFVGEIRDNETAGIAVNAALTGHLVLSTLHTNDAPTAIPRLIDMKVEPFLVASTVNLVVAQRLIRKTCEHCKEETAVDKKELVSSFSKETIDAHFPDSKNATQVNMIRGKGCNKCNFTGYLGRIGVFELLEISKDIRNLITSRAEADVIRAQALTEGMVSMMDDGLNKVAAGLTSTEEVLRATKVES